MWSMVLVEDCGLVWGEDGVALEDGPTDTDPIGDGVAIGGVVLVLDLGARIINVITNRFPGPKKVKAFSIECSKP